MEINYKEIADRAVVYAREKNIILDFTEKSIEEVDDILGSYYEHLDEYDRSKGADALWNIAVHFGIYLGETILHMQLKEKGYQWFILDKIPILKNENNIEISPIVKAHKRILNGPEDSVKSFCNVAFSIANGTILTNKIHRVINVECSSGESAENVLYKDIDNFIMYIEDGLEDFLILSSEDGFLQFYGVNNQFIVELRINLPNNDFRTYSFINKDKEELVERVPFTTPYGEFTPTEREIVSLELVKAAVKKYYATIHTEDILKDLPIIETTEEMKRCMGLIE